MTGESSGAAPPAVARLVPTAPVPGRRKYRRTPSPCGLTDSEPVVAGSPVRKGPLYGASGVGWTQASTVPAVAAYTWRRPDASVAVTGSPWRPEPPKACHAPKGPSGVTCARARRVRRESRTYTVIRPVWSTETDGALSAEVTDMSTLSGVPSDCHGPKAPSGAAWTAYTRSRPYSSGVAPRVVRVPNTAILPSGSRTAVAPASMPVPGRNRGPNQGAWGPLRDQYAIRPSRAAKAHSRPETPSVIQEVPSPRL